MLALLRAVVPTLVLVVCRRRRTLSAGLLLLLAFPSRAAEEPPVPPPVKAALGEGVTFTSPDGQLTAQVRARVQLRAETLATDGEGPVVGLLVRRLRTTLKASALDGLFDLYVQLAFAPRELEADNPFVLRDAQATLNVHRDLRLRVGQMKVPFDHQRWVSSGALAFPDRAAVTVALTLDRDLGAVWLSDDLFGLGVLQAQAGVFGGDGRNRINQDTGLLYVARVQLTPLGAFSELDEVELDRDAPARVAVAAAAGFNDDTPRGLSTTGSYELEQRTDFLHANLDLLGKVAGMSGFVGILLRVATEVKGHDDAVSAAGAVLQLGALVTDHVEVVGRAARFDPLPGGWLPIPNPGDVVGHTELRPGVNVYLHGHEVKVQTSVGVMLADDLTRTVDGQVQLQLWF